jgi:hypothetical protein
METHVTITQGAAPAHYNEPPSPARLTGGKADPLGRVGGSPRPGKAAHGSDPMGVHHSETRPPI